MPNRLAESSSPYLLQHQDNPVDWYEWGNDAFRTATERDVPVLLSVGYASCHWCHVMAHESFEDDATAQVMNQLFVNVKVDREERPDVDRIYMDAVQAMTGRGGWPMTVFLTPDGQPFFAGTYFPKEDRAGHPAFVRVLESVSEAWHGQRDQVLQQAGRLTQAVQASVPAAEDLPGTEEFEAASRALVEAHDPVHGGFGGAPKFPQAPTLEFLLRAIGEDWAPDARRILEHTLKAMAAGGIYDHLGGGFARYSVDDHWLVPHFEKMLYDNALLARLYARAAQATGDDDFGRIANETLDYLDRDLGLPEGGFASAEDADSEGVEGRFYVFDHNEVTAAAPEHGEAVALVLGSTPAGNFEGKVIVHAATSITEAAAETGVDPDELGTAVAATKARLFEQRSERIRPELDDKAVCAWNGLAIRAFAEAGVALGRPDRIERAVTAAEFVLGEMRRADGRLARTWRRGKVGGPGFADDYGSTALGLFSLYQATGDERWFIEAETLTRRLLDDFWDDEAGGVFATGHDAERLIARPKNLFDNPTPSDNSLAAEALLHLHAFTGDADLLDRIAAIQRLAGRLLAQYPAAVGQLLAVSVTAASGPRQLVVVGENGRDELVATATERFRPDLFLAATPEPSDRIPLLQDRVILDDTATAYLCRDMVCDLPTTDPTVLAEQLGR